MADMFKHFYTKVLKLQEKSIKSLFLKENLAVFYPDKNCLVHSLNKIKDTMKAHFCYTRCFL